MRQKHEIQIWENPLSRELHKNHNNNNNNNKRSNVVHHSHIFAVVSATKLHAARLLALATDCH